MKRSLVVTIGVWCVTLLCQVPSFAEDDGLAIMKKVDARNEGTSLSSRMHMILLDNSNLKRERSIAFFRKNAGNDSKRIFFFLNPADVKNTGFLSYDYDNPAVDDDQWLYLPALRKTKRIAASEKKNSFMGTDFSYADMATRQIANYTYKVIKEDEVEGHKVWLILETPRDAKIVDSFGYTKSILFVRQDNYVIIRSVNWVKDDGSLKYYQINKLELIDNVWVAVQFQMVKKKGDQVVHKTTISLDGIRLNTLIPDEQFSIRSLEKGI